MLSRRLHAVAVAGAVAVLAAGCTSDDSSSGDDSAESGASAELTAFAEQDVVWTGCLKASGECAGFDVPVDYDDPDGETVSLSVRRIPATGEAEGTLFFNPGGPGVSGVQELSWFAEGLSAEVRERYDLVGFDPRGIADSQGLDCTPREGRRSIAPPDQTPDSTSEQRRLIRWHQNVARACVEWDSDLVRNMSSVEVARDLDVMRAAFGDEKLNYYGASYGSVIADRYLAMFPDRAGRIVIDSPLDRSRSDSKSMLSSVKAHKRTLRGYLRFCVNRSCPLGGSVDEATAELAGLLDRLDASPLPAGAGELTENDARAALESGLATSAWPQLTKAFDGAMNGDGSRLARLALRWRGGNLDRASMLDVSGFGTACLDNPERVGVQGARNLVPKYARASEIFGEYFGWTQLQCASWPIDAPPTPKPNTDELEEPVVVIGSMGDPLTPYADAVSLTERIQPSTLLTSRTYSHGAYARGLACIDNSVDAYLLDGEAPTDGKQC